MDERPLTPAERTLVRSMFGNAINLEPVRLRRRSWWPLQAANVVMAPMGHLHFTPDSTAWRDCFACEPVTMQAFFLHEMTHVWQAQTRGRWWLVMMRHPWCRYDYAPCPGKPFDRYGIEQQGEIVAHAHLLRHGVGVKGKPGLAFYESVLPFAQSESMPS